MDDRPQYRATHYNYKAWQIEQLVIPEKDSKKKEPYWKIIKYPGSLQNAVRGLLDLGMSDFTLQSVERLETAVTAVEQQIMAAVDSLFQARDGDA